METGTNKLWAGRAYHRRTGIHLSRRSAAKAEPVSIFFPIHHLSASLAPSNHAKIPVIKPNQTKSRRGGEPPPILWTVRSTIRPSTFGVRRSAFGVQCSMLDVPPISQLFPNQHLTSSFQPIPDCAWGILAWDRRRPAGCRYWPGLVGPEPVSISEFFFEIPAKPRHYARSLCSGAL